MDYVARAKALLVGKAQGALLVLPLAAAVQLAQAGQIPVIYTLPTGNVQCQAVGDGGSFGCSGSATNIGPQDGLEGVSLSALPVEFDFSGSPYSGINTGSLTLSSSGVLTNSAAQTFGVENPSLPTGTTLSEHYNFSVSGNLSGGWSLAYEITDTTTQSILFNDSGNVSGSFVSGGGFFSGGFTDTIAAPLTVGDSYLVTAELSFTAPYTVSGGSFTVTVDPTKTFDVGTDQQAPTPEPSTLSFGALGLAAVGVWRGLRGKRKADLQ